MTTGHKPENKQGKKQQCITHTFTYTTQNKAVTHDSNVPQTEHFLKLRTPPAGRPSNQQLQLRYSQTCVPTNGPCAPVTGLNENERPLRSAS